mgnify:CR=1 FL=1
MSDQGLSIFDEQSGQTGKGSPDDKTQVIPVAQGDKSSQGGQPSGASGNAPQRPVVPPAARPGGAPSAPAAAPGFPVVRRGGYDTASVDAKVRQLLGEKSGLAQSLTESEQRVVELEAELERVRTEVAEMERPSYAGLGGRASAMLRLAEEEAADVRAAAERLGWVVAAEDPTTGHLEATDTTRFFRFVDDVVVRVRPDGSGSIVDIRSKSRDGRGDLGANAARIRALQGSL